MKEYRIICDDTEHQCGDIYEELDGLVGDVHYLTRGHDDQHSHMVQVREVSDWMAYAPKKVLT